MLDLADLRTFARIADLGSLSGAALTPVLIGGAGIGRLPDFYAADAVADGRLVRLLPDHQDDAVEVHALYSSHRSLSAKVRVFMDALAEHLTRTA